MLEISMVIFCLGLTRYGISTCIHAAGYMLNPSVFYKDHACNDPEVISSIEVCITQMANGNYDPKKVKAQTEVYRRKLGSLGSDSSAIKGNDGITTR
jgi:hypothetical protein